MPAQLNHTIVSAHDNRASAEFMAEILGLPAPTPFGPFLVVEADNGVSLDFIETQGDITPQHYAFLISEPEFDEIFGRIKSETSTLGGSAPCAARRDQPPRRRPRGLLRDPDGHLLEIITRPYGSGS